MFAAILLAARLQEPAVAPSVPAPRSAGTIKMAALLEELAQKVDFDRCAFFATERAKTWNPRVKNSAGTPREIEARMGRAKELILSNQIEEGLADLARVEELHAPTCPNRDCELDGELLEQQSIAWQRLGEIENCITRHGCTSCILPIADGAVHVEKRGSENAEKVLLELLRRDPNDLDARWRLNLVAMTLGTWPDSVPEQHRIPEKAFQSDYDIGRFPDVARECGVDPVTLSGGVVAEDFDGDGFIDLLCSSIGLRDRLWLYKNNGDGTFTERAAAAGLAGLVGGLNMIHGDYDNDGDEDVLVLRGAWLAQDGELPNSLLRNRGNGDFDDVTVEAGVLSFHPTQAGRFADFDGDGWLDLVIGNESGMRGHPQPCELYLNQRNGTFRDVAREVGADMNAFVKAVAVGDYDNDGREDLYYSCRKGENVLLKNEACIDGVGFHFRDVTTKAHVQLPKMSFPCFFFDYDNDGWQDLWVGTQTGFSNERADEICRLYLGQRMNVEKPMLYHNRGDGTFESVGTKMGTDRLLFAMSANYADLDNDGWLDFYVGTGSPDLRALLPNQMFRNDQGKHFQDVTASGGFGHLQKGHGIAFADFDRDGDADLYSVLGGAVSGDVYPNALFENPGHGNHQVTLRLHGIKANRDAIGARVHLRLATPSGERSLHRVVTTGGSFGSSCVELQIGLGDATKILSADIRWPGSGTQQHFDELPLDRWIAIEEGKPTFEAKEWKSFKLGKKSGS